MKLQRRQFSVSFQNKLEDDNKLVKYCEEQFLLNHYFGGTEHNIRMKVTCLKFRKKVLSNVNQFSNKNFRNISLLESLLRIA